MALSAGTRLGRYEVVSLLGVGGMGEVYRARDTRLGRDVAVKVLPEELAADAERLHRFEREALAVAALNHPNILTIHDVGVHDRTSYAVTELLEGENLRALVSRRSRPLAADFRLCVRLRSGWPRRRAVVERRVASSPAACLRSAGRTGRRRRRGGTLY